MTEYLYKNLSRKMKYDILRGDYPPGSRFPSLRVLAGQEQCNLATVKRAIQVLEQEHLVFPKHTKGIFVTDNAVLIQKMRYEEQMALIESLYKKLMILGFSRNEILTMIQECGYGQSV